VKGHNNFNEKYIKIKLLNFTIVLNKKWNKYYRNYSKFIEKEDQWLKTIFNCLSKIASDNVGCPNYGLGHFAAVNFDAIVSPPFNLKFFKKLKLKIFITCLYCLFTFSPVNFSGRYMYISPLNQYISFLHIIIYRPTIFRKGGIINLQH
jgi:hypothetical protein